VRILVEAYACRPASGSEGGRGWFYPLEFARRGHDVTVITCAQERPGVTAALTFGDGCGLRFVFVPRRSWPLRLGWTVGSALQYRLWLAEAAQEARHLDAREPFDVLHHASYATLLGGTYLWRLGRPLVFGPVGGGQTTPRAFGALFGRWWRSEQLRSFVVRYAWRVDRAALRAVRSAAVVLASNEDTLHLALRMGARRSRLWQDVALPAGMAPAELAARRGADSGGAEPGRGLRLLWLGRIMPRKALQLAVLAVAGTPASSGITLTIVGRGANDEMDAEFRRWLASLDLGDRVRLAAEIPHSQVSAAYLAADAFVFPSVRETLGMQVLEAMAHGLPIVCLDHQGLKTFVPDDGGVRVPVSDIPGTVEGLRKAFLRLAGDPEGRERMARLNFERARHATWEQNAGVLLDVFREVLAGAGALSPLNIRLET
jgi:glycosyltransferase involved in cell wall biosynthesis